MIQYQVFWDSYKTIWHGKYTRWLKTSFEKSQEGESLDKWTSWNP